MNIMQVKRGTTEDWSLGPELIHFENLMINGSDSTIRCEGIHIKMYAYTNSANYFPTDDTHKQLGLWLIQPGELALWSDGTEYQLRMKVIGPEDCVVRVTDQSYELDCMCCGNEDIVKTLEGYQSDLRWWVQWPEEKSIPEEIDIYISIKAIGAYEELAPGQIGIEYLDTDEVKLKVGKPGITKWNQLPYVTSQVDPYRSYQSDIPKNEGVLNAILNMKQICEIITEPIKTMYLRNNVPYSEPFSGLPYTNSTAGDGMVPIYTSFETYASGLINPYHSMYFLSNDRKYPPYGSSCSASISYALNFPAAYPSSQFPSLPNIIEVPFETLELGDILWREGHIAMVIDITRNRRGRIGQIVTSELTDDKAHYQNWGYNELTKAYTNLYRYSQIHKVSHISSEYVPVEDEDTIPFNNNTEYTMTPGNKGIYSYENNPLYIVFIGNTYANGTITILNEQNGIVLKEQIPDFDSEYFEFMFEDASSRCVPGLYSITIANQDETVTSPYHNSFMVISTSTNLDYNATTQTLSVQHDDERSINPNSIKPSFVRWINSDNATSYISVIEDFDSNGTAAIPIPEPIKDRTKVWVSIGYITPYGTIFTGSNISSWEIVLDTSKTETVS